MTNNNLLLKKENPINNNLLLKKESPINNKLILRNSLLLLFLRRQALNFELNKRANIFSNKVKLKFFKYAPELPYEKAIFIKDLSYPYQKKFINVNINNQYFSKYSAYNLNINNRASVILSQYLNSRMFYKSNRKGIIMSHSKFIGYNFKSAYAKTKYINRIISQKNINSLLFESFYSMHSFISKPVFKISHKKVVIKLFYFLNMPYVLKFMKYYFYTKKLDRRYNTLFPTKFSDINDESLIDLRNSLVNKYKNNENDYNTKKNFLELDNSILNAAIIENEKKMHIKNKRKSIDKFLRKFNKLKLKQRFKLIKVIIFNLPRIYPEKFKILCKVLSQFFKKPVEFYLTRIHYPYHDSTILANLFATCLKKIFVIKIFSKIWANSTIKDLSVFKSSNSFLNSFITGINIKVAGKLTRNIKSRRKKRMEGRGSSAPGKVNYIDVARYTGKRKKSGTYSITINSGQNFF